MCVNGVKKGLAFRSRGPLRRNLRLDSQHDHTRLSALFADRYLQQFGALIQISAEAAASGRSNSS